MRQRLEILQMRRFSLLVVLLVLLVLLLLSLTLSPVVLLEVLLLVVVSLLVRFLAKLCLVWKQFSVLHVWLVAGHHR